MFFFCFVLCFYLVCAVANTHGGLREVAPCEYRFSAEIVEPVCIVLPL